MTDCVDCKNAETTMFCGVYNLHCVKCCARLIISARPSRMQQEANFTLIERHDFAPKREEILKCINDSGL